MRVCSTAIVGICASVSTPRTSPGRMYGTLCLDRVRSTSMGGQAAVPASTRKFPIAGSNDILLMVCCLNSTVEERKREKAQERKREKAQERKGERKKIPRNTPWHFVA